MRSPQIRSTFIDFFTHHGHRLVPSGSLIPNDPTLLLTNAGMVQFKPYFLGEALPQHLRVTSLQKCARTVDIDNVGRTTRHATFFEMLGNFSFGDYFKADAISWAWELVTEQFNLERDRLWATVYEDDDEAVDLWRKVGIPAERIQRMGKADNFWSMGVPGPCGPCSEVFYDRGPAYGRGGGPAANGERYLEIWNLVFMQHVRGDGSGKDDYPILGELPRKCIDTGMGVDRMAIVLQGVSNVCQTDLLAPVLRQVQELSGRDYHESPQTRLSCQVIAEHARSASFLIADGVLPSNECRGYVLRRLLRRAVRHARLLGIGDLVLPTLAGTVVDNLGDVWPELQAQRTLIEQVTASEEATFNRTLRQGSRLLDAAIGRARSKGEATLPAESAFELHDTFGFPLDLTLEIARDAGLAVDRDRIGQLMDDQRRRAKAARARLAGDLRLSETHRVLAARHGRTTFVGYDRLAAEARVLGLLVDGDEQPVAAQGQRIELILDRTPLYAEAGGQVGDTGTIRTREGAEIRVTDTNARIAGLHLHTARVVSGEIRAGETVEALVDADRRDAIARSHSATHVLHALLRRALGEHAKQQGSLVAPGRLRFDFAHFSPVDPEQLAAVEDDVNQHLLADPEVRVWQASRAEAEAAGAAALFGEQYGDVVRVVDIGGFSRELCGGTHVAHGSQAGPFRLLGESSVGANLRRIEALTGLDALRHADTERRILAEAAKMLGVPQTGMADELRKRLDDLAAARRELGRIRQRELGDLAAVHAGRARQDGNGWLVAERIAGVDAAELRLLATAVLGRCPSDRPGIVILGTVAEDSALLVAAISSELAEEGLQARDVLLAAAMAVGGGAGGRGEVANAGGRHTNRLDEALSLARREASTYLTRR